MVAPRLIVLLLLLGACSQTPAIESTTPTTQPTTTTTEMLDAAGIYELVSPSLAFVETAIGSGSAVLFDPTTLVTNAHVVWPDDRVMVTFPDGPSGMVPVIGYDWMADLALIDVSTLSPLPPHTNFETNVPGPGTAVHLVGYPADDAGSAAPAITAGIVSRTRSWEEGRMTFIQSDALISGGQSGGALVDEHGWVVGISGLSVGDGFALALAARDVDARIASIRSGTDFDSLGERSVKRLTGQVMSEGSVNHVLDELVFTFDGRAGDSVSIEISGSAPFNADLVGPDGYVEATSVDPSVRVLLEADLVLPGPYFVVVYPESEPLSAVRVEGVDTRAWIDPDHGKTLVPGVPLAGNGDYPGDLDWYLLNLEAGQTVGIRASSINIDASLLIDLFEPTVEFVFVSDSDSGGGVIGYDAFVDFTASESDTYVVAVFDETGFGPGGYVITVEPIR
jgi:hypothetical protein